MLARFATSFTFPAKKALHRCKARCAMSDALSDSGVSDTDVRIFCELGNPAKVNMERLRAEANEAIHAQLRRQDMPPVQEEDDDDVPQSDYDSDEPERQPEPEPPRIEEVLDDDKDVVPSEPDDDSVLLARCRAATCVLATTCSRPCPRAAQPCPLRRTKRRARPRPRRSSSSRPRAPTTTDEESELLEKQQILLDMERLKLRHGVRLSKVWTVDDNIADMQFELRRHLAHAQEAHNVRMMRDGMRLACSGIELLNQRVGLLELDGWAAEVCSDMDQYDGALGRIWRKYWRYSHSMSPETEILYGILASMGMFHFKRKFSKTMMRSRGVPLASTARRAPHLAPPRRRTTATRKHPRENQGHKKTSWAFFLVHAAMCRVP